MLRDMFKCLFSLGIGKHGAGLSIVIAKCLFSLGIGKHGVGLSIVIAGKECMFRIVSRCLHIHLHGILNVKVV